MTQRSALGSHTTVGSPKFSLSHPLPWQGVWKLPDVALERTSPLELNDLRSRARWRALRRWHRAGERERRQNESDIRRGRTAPAALRNSKKDHDGRLSLSAVNRL